MYKFEQQNLSANDTTYCELQENVAIELVTDTMMVKSARTKKFDDEIDLIFVNRGLE